MIAWTESHIPIKTEDKWWARWSLAHPVFKDVGDNDNDDSNKSPSKKTTIIDLAALEILVGIVKKIVDLGAKHLFRLNQTSSYQIISMCHYTHTPYYTHLFTFSSGWHSHLLWPPPIVNYKKMVELGVKHLLRLNQTSSYQNTSMCHYTHTILHALVYVFVWLTFPSVVSSPHPALDYTWYVDISCHPPSQLARMIIIFSISLFSLLQIPWNSSLVNMNSNYIPSLIKSKKKLNSIELHKILEEVGGAAHLVVYHTFENA